MFSGTRGPFPWPGPRCGFKDAGTVHANFHVPATATGRVSRDVSTAVRSRLDGQIIIYSSPRAKLLFLSLSALVTIYS